MFPDIYLHLYVTFKLRFSDYFSGFSDDTGMAFVDTDYGLYLVQCLDYCYLLMPHSGVSNILRNPSDMLKPLC